MKNSEKSTTATLIVIIALLVILGFALYFYPPQRENGRIPGQGTPSQPVDIDDEDEDEIDEPNTVVTPPTPAPSARMTINLYLQDKEVAAVSDCGVTRRVTREINRTPSVLDESLKILFDEELSQYGRYQSVSLQNGVATVMLASNQTPAGGNISGLSSCEARHLMAVLNDTLTQYSTVNSVRLTSPQGEIQF